MFSGSVLALTLARSTAAPWTRPAAVAAGFSFPRPIASPPQRIAPTPAAAGVDRTAIGVIAMLASTVAFPLSDLAAQSLMASLPSLEVVWLRYMVLLLAVAPLLARRGTLRSSRPGLQVLRGTTGALATIAALVAFKFLAVAETTAIGFVAPVIVTALAALVLKETVGLRRWGAALAALVGVLIIVQPGAGAFRPAALIPLAGAAVNAVTVICTRLNKSDAPGTTLAYSALVGGALLSALVVADWQTPTWPELGVALVVGLFGALGSLLQVVAYRLAPAATLAPFTFTQLIWACGLSFVVLGAVPGPAMVLGSAVIAASAIYTAMRERARGVA